MKALLKHLNKSTAMTKEEILTAYQDLRPKVYSHKQAVRSMQEYATQEKQGWVRIESTETMPPYFEHIIVFGGEVHCRLFSKSWVALPHDEFVTRTGISHWMPLPQKPEV